MKEWYTRQEVSDILGVSKATVYQYAKQKKIIKIEDPHRLIREARYKCEEVDALVELRKRNRPDGMRPSELAKQLGVPVTRIYAAIKDNGLQVDEIILGDEAKGISISDELVELIHREILRTTPTRARRIEFYDSKRDIALFQRFISASGQDIRVLRNDNLEWGFYLQSHHWISFEQGIGVHQYKPVYSIHQENRKAVSYTDFILPKNWDGTFNFIDFVYEVWGIENIRLRELETEIAISIKSGKMKFKTDVPEILSDSLISTFVTLGEVIQSDDEWELIGGYRRTTFDLPIDLLDTLIKMSKQSDMTMSEYVEAAINEKFGNKK